MQTMEATRTCSTSRASMRSSTEEQNHSDSQSEEIGSGSTVSWDTVARKKAPIAFSELIILIEIHSGSTKVSG